MNTQPLLAIVIVCSACASLNGQTLGPLPLLVERYTIQLSYVPGEAVALHVSTSAAKLHWLTSGAGFNSVSHGLRDKASVHSYKRDFGKQVN